MQHIRTRGLAGGITTALATSCFAQSPTQRAAMLSHLDAVPGVPGAAYSLGLGGATVLNDAGRVAFAAAFGPPTGTGVWSEGSGTLRLIAISGGPAPGAPGRTFTSFGSTKLVMSRGDRVAFTQQVTGSFTPYGVWSQEGPDLALVCLTGGIAPVSPPGLWSLDSLIPDLAMSRNGRVAFRTGFAVGNGTYSALFYGVPSGVLMCARTELDMSLPGFVAIGNPQFNDTLTFCNLSPYRNNDGTRVGLWTGRCAALVPVIIHGATVPGYVGLPEFTTFINPFSFAINGGNQVAFVSGLNGTGVTAANDSVLWIATNSGFRIIAREGDQVPGLPVGCFYSDFTLSTIGPVISDSGHVVVATNINGPGVGGNSRIILRYAPDGTRRVVARTGDQVPNYPAGNTYLSFAGNGLALNASGQLLFSASTFSPPPGRGGAFAMCIDPNDRARIVVETNTPYMVRPGVTVRLSTPTEPLVSGGSDGRPRNWNDRAEFAFRAGYQTVGAPAVSGVGTFVFGAGHCVADLDDGSGAGVPDGGVTIDDLLYYLQLFEAGALAADVDDGTSTGTPDEGVTIDDLLYYLVRFEAGC